MSSTLTSNVIATFILLLLASPLLSLGSLEGLIKGVLEDVDSKVVQELRTVIQVSAYKRPSRTLKDVKFRTFARHICSVTNTSGVSQMISEATATLEASLADQAWEEYHVIIARRTLMACIALHLVSQKDAKLDGNVEESLADLTRWFYNAHVSSVARRGVLEHLHISKSGGTTFSATADKNNCSMTAGIGQPQELGDLPRWINGTAFMGLSSNIRLMWSYYNTDGRGKRAVASGCRERYNYLQYRRLNYLSNEFTVQGGEDGLRGLRICPQVVNAVTLRHPDGRIVSHLHFMLSRIKKRLYSVENIFVPAAAADLNDGGEDKEGAGGAEPDPDAGDVSSPGLSGGLGLGMGLGDAAGGGIPINASELFQRFCTANLSVWQGIAPTVADNYMTRSFVGERIFHAPVGSIGEEHVAMARRLLLQFDLVFDLEAGAAAADGVLEGALGWHAKMSEVHMRSSTSVYAKLNYSTAECRDDELVRELQARQGPDRQLYSFGRVLALLDRIHFAMARHLGLQPALDASGRAAEAGEAARRGASCGLLSAGSQQATPAAATAAADGASAPADEAAAAADGTSTAADGASTAADGASTAADGASTAADATSAAADKASATVEATATSDMASAAADKASAAAGGASAFAAAGEGTAVALRRRLL